MVEGVVDFVLVVEDCMVLDDVSSVFLVEEGVDDFVVVDSRVVDDSVVDELVVVGSEVILVDELMVDVDVAADVLEGISVEVVMVVEGVVLVIVLVVEEDNEGVISIDFIVVVESFLIPFLIPIIETATPVSASFTRAPKIPS